MKPSRAALVGVALVFCAVGALAQSEIGQQEGFEGARWVDPSGDFYTFTTTYVDTTCFSSNGVFSGTCRDMVTTPGLDGTAQAYKIVDSTASSPDPFSQFTLASPQQFSNMSFFFKNLGNPSSPSSLEISLDLRDTSGDMVFSFHSFGYLNGASGCTIVGGCMQFNMATCNLVDALNPTDFGVGSEVKITIAFDWVAKNADLTATMMSTGAVKTYNNCGFVNAAATELRRLEIHDDGAIAGFLFDQWQLDGGPIAAEEPGVPSEFDSGLLAFITGLGFRTPESQFFFSLILVGITTVSTGVGLKFMAPGRLKLILTGGLAALVACFCVILAMFDLWMLVLALVLGGSTVMGTKEFTNTWRELRASIGRGSQVLDEDGNVQDDALFKVPSNPKGRVERREFVAPPPPTPPEAPTPTGVDE